ncbi:MAG: hypothetical protein ACK4YP_11515 [Myxococcota bacterium]
MIDIPWDKLAIPDALRGMVDPVAPKRLRLAAAKGALPATGEALVGMLYALACGEDADVRAAAVATLETMPGLANTISQRTHPKVLELIATTRAERELDEKIMLVRAANDRTATLIAARADAKLCEIICENHERLLLTPAVIVALHQNPACADVALERAVSFLRMQQSLPELPPSRPAAGAPKVERPVKAAAKPVAPPVFDLEAEIEAALTGRPSPHKEQQKLQMFDLDRIGGGLDGFSFDFTDEDEFGADLLDENAESSGDPDTAANLAKRIAGMTTGKKLKLAYLGNKSCRDILIRDRNKLVAVAVVKSGRLSDGEVLTHAGNRNLPEEALREIATNREWTRKYPVKVALVNNPKCPPSVSISLVPYLQAKDLASLSRNRNVSSVVFSLAGKLAKQKAG